MRQVLLFHALIQPAACICTAEDNNTFTLLHPYVLPFTSVRFALHVRTCLLFPMHIFPFTDLPICQFRVYICVFQFVYCRIIRTFAPGIKKTRLNFCIKANEIVTISHIYYRTKMKKQYQSPQTKVVCAKCASMLCSSVKGTEPVTISENSYGDDCWGEI